MIKRFLILIGGVALVFLSLGAFKAAQIKEMSSQAHVMPAASVTSAKAEQDTWQPTLKSIATLAPVEGVLLAADAEGTITRIAVENGAAVKAGDVLVEFDTTVETAQLAAAEARHRIASLDRKRAEELLAKNTISQAELDAADAQLRQTEADAAAVRALLGKKIVRAPFSGRVGIRLINLGQFVARGAPLMPLQRMDPMYVDLQIPQRQLPQVAVGQRVNVRVDAFPDRVFEGKISAINPAVDSASRNVSVQATIANPDEILRSGMFARAEIELKTGKPEIVLPATAISYASYGNSVFIIEKMKHPDGSEYLGVRQTFVKLGAARGDMISILEGVKPGEEVVTSGVFKLRNGLEVQVNNTVRPGNQLDPKPANT